LNSDNNTTTNWETKTPLSTQKYKRKEEKKKRNGCP
jgi:hypothetical protein